MAESQARGRRMIDELINAFPGAGTYPNHIDYFEAAEGLPELKWGKENAATLNEETQSQMGPRLAFAVPPVRGAIGR